MYVYMVDLFSYMCMYLNYSHIRVYGRLILIHVYMVKVFSCMCIWYTAPEASWRRVLDPCTPILFDLYHYLEQNGYF